MPGPKRDAPSLFVVFMRVFARPPPGRVKAVPHLRRCSGTVSENRQSRAASSVLITAARRQNGSAG